MNSIQQTFEGLTYSIEARDSDPGIELWIGPFNNEPENLDRIEAELVTLAAIFYSRYATTDQPNKDQVCLVLPTGDRKDLGKIVATIEKRGAVAKRNISPNCPVVAQMPCAQTCQLELASLLKAD